MQIAVMVRLPVIAKCRLPLRSHGLQHDVLDCVSTNRDLFFTPVVLYLSEKVSATLHVIKISYLKCLFELFI